jgi:hypothetical protein
MKNNDVCGITPFFFLLVEAMIGMHVQHDKGQEMNKSLMHVQHDKGQEMNKSLTQFV